MVKYMWFAVSGLKCAKTASTLFSANNLAERRPCQSLSSNPSVLTVTPILLLNKFASFSYVTLSVFSPYRFEEMKKRKGGHNNNT